MRQTSLLLQAVSAKKLIGWQAFWLTLWLALCLAACKTEPDLPSDPHFPLVNAFVGIWEEGGQYWQFRPDGTGGRASAPSGTFPDTFSFLLYTGQDTLNPTDAILIILDDNAEGGVDVNCYDFTVSGNQAVLTPRFSLADEPDSITLERVEGSPRVLSVTNPLIGEWNADWSWPGEEHDGGQWSLKYRTDGTLKLYHRPLHQFENSYALRRDTLVIYGDWRFGGLTWLPIIAEISLQPNGQVRVQETQEYPGPATWVYTKVNAAIWK